MGHRLGSCWFPGRHLADRSMALGPVGHGGPIAARAVCRLARS
jgi:hypothetical protein